LGILVARRNSVATNTVIALSGQSAALATAACVIECAEQTVIAHAAIIG
jgi:hypothetical protein